MMKGDARIGSSTNSISVRRLSAMWMAWGVPDQADSGTRTFSNT